MILGKWELPPYAMLAPMAGVSDRALRELAMRFGAVACVGEMVSCKGLVQGSRKSAELMEIGPLEMPCAIQLFGDEPEPMARAAELAQQYSPAWLDINMGCPAPKIAGNRSGSALMLEPDRAESIIRAVKEASSIPVTVKFRKGWDDSHINAVEFAQMAEAAGADAVTVHGRTRQQMYAPPVDWEIIRQVKKRGFHPGHWQRRCGEPRNRQGPVRNHRLRSHHDRPGRPGGPVAVPAGAAVPANRGI